MKDKFLGRHDYTTKDKYYVDYLSCRINPINGKDIIYRALIYKNNSVIKVLGAFDEENLQLQIDNYFNNL